MLRVQPKTWRYSYVFRMRGICFLDSFIHLVCLWRRRTEHCVWFRMLHRPNPMVMSLPPHNCRYISQLATLQSHFCRRTMMRNRGRNQAPHHILPPRERPELIQELNDNDMLLGWGTQTGGDLICETAWFWAPLTPLWLGHCCSVGLGPCQYIGNRRLHDLGLLLKEEYYNVSKSYKVKKIIGRKMYDEILRRGGWFLQQVSKGMGGRDALYDEVDRKKCKEKWKQLLWEKPSNKEEQTPETSSMMKMQDVAERRSGPWW
jgi:hypothetical protein